MKAIGSLICNMVTALKPGLIIQCIKDSINKAKSMVWELSLGVMGHILQVIGKIIKLLEMENIHGAMAENMKENGSTT